MKKREYITVDFNFLVKIKERLMSLEEENKVLKILLDVDVNKDYSTK